VTLSYQHTDHVRHAVCAGVLTVTIDRPEKRNPLSLGVLAEITEIFRRNATEPDLRYAVVGATGGRAFASGGDLDELAAFKTEGEAAAFSRHGKSALDSIRYFPVPVIARIDGLALGGGAELALACDMRFASANSRIGFIHGRLRISPSWGGGIDLIRLIGPARALMMMTRAGIVDAFDAQAMGLFDVVAPENQGDTAFAAFVAPLDAQSPQVMRAYKSLSIVDRKFGRQEADTEETRHFATVWAHPDHWDAVAELEKRKN
jgi:enoyl-CoA hydratase